MYSVYEFFLINGAKMSTRNGNVYITQDMMDIMEPEAFLYFYSLNPMKQKNLEVKNINFLVDAFDRFEKIYYDEIEPAGRRREGAGEAGLPDASATSGAARCAYRTRSPPW